MSKKQHEKFNDLEFHKEILDEVIYLGLIDIVIGELITTTFQKKMYWDRLSVKKLDTLKDNIKKMI